MTEPTFAALAIILKRDLHAFVRLAFERMVSPQGVRQTMAMRLVCATLQQVAEGVVRRQTINQPPRTLKSFISSVCFPAWLLARDPGTKITLICHDQRLVQDLADRCRQILRSDWYLEMFPDTRLRADASERTQFKTTAGGGVFAASMSAGLTGHGGDVIIIDDPIDAGDAYSAVERNKVNSFYDGKITSRLDNRAEGKIVIVMQRLHPDDLCGHVQGRPGYRHLVVPLVADELMVFEAGDFAWERPAGDIIDPVSYPAEEIQRLRQELPAHVFQAQYQQAPARLDGGIVKAEWFGQYDSIPHAAHEVVFSCDFGQTVGETSSYSCVLVFRTDGVNHYLIDVMRKRAGLIELREDMRRLFTQYPSTGVLIEDAALGSSLIEILRELRMPVVRRPRPTKGKPERLEAILYLVSGGRVLLPRVPRPWVDTFLAEVCAFPGGGHDDQVDALSQYLSWAADANRRHHPPALATASGPVIGRPGEKWKPHPQRDPKGPPRMPRLPFRGR